MHTTIPLNSCFYKQPVNMTATPGALSGILSLTRCWWRILWLTWTLPTRPQKLWGASDQKHSPEDSRSLLPQVSVPASVHVLHLWTKIKFTMNFWLIQPQPFYAGVQELETISQPHPYGSKKTSVVVLELVPESRNATKYLVCLSPESSQ